MEQAHLGHKSSASLSGRLVTILKCHQHAVPSAIKVKYTEQLWMEDVHFFIMFSEITM